MADFFQENLFEASWKGVDFYAEESGYTLGRRVAVHEFVQRDTPFVEDLGRAKRSQKISGRIVANKDNDYNPWPERDALIRAVEEGGDGVFISPFYGEQRGHVSDFEINETSTKGGGLIRFTFTFIESGAAEYNGQYAAVVTELPSAVASYDAAQDDFIEAFDVGGFGGYVVTDAASNIGQFLSETSGLKISDLSPSDILTSLGINQTLAAVQGARNILKNMVNGATMTSQQIAVSVISIVSTLDDLAKLKFFTVPYGLKFATRGNVRARANGAAMQNLVKSAAVTRQAQIAAQITTPRYDTVDTARGLPRLTTRVELEATRATLSEDMAAQIEDLSGQYVFDDTQAALTKLKSDTVAYMTAQGEHLARVYFTSTCDTTVAQVSMPALVVAYRHYGQLYDESIVLRNDVEHPLFIAPHRTLELLALDNAETFLGRV